MVQAPSFAVGLVYLVFILSSTVHGVWHVRPNKPQQRPQALPQRAPAVPYYPFNNCDTSNQTEWDLAFEVQLSKRIHQRRLMEGYHDLLRSTDLDDLARSHSEEMQADNRLSDRNIGRRRALVLSNGYWWFRAENIEKDPKYAPLAVTTIDEIYANGSNPRTMWKDAFEKAQSILGPSTRLWHQWIGVGVVCSTNSSGHSHFWATIILVGVCSASTINAPAPTFTPHMCCDLPPAFAQCSLPRGAAFFYAYDAITREVEPVCCSSTSLLGSQEVPPQSTTSSGLVTQTIPAGSTQHKEMCYCVTHDIPLPSAVNVTDYVREGHIHFGKAGQQSESLVLHSLSNLNASSEVRGCWNYADSGVCLSGLLAGSVYLHLHSNTTFSDPTPPAHGLIRGQLSCFGYALDFHEGLSTTVDGFSTLIG